MYFAIVSSGCEEDSPTFTECLTNLLWRTLRGLALLVVTDAGAWMVKPSAAASAVSSVALTSPDVYFGVYAYGLLTIAFGHTRR